ncbi:MAG: twin-arginine translocase subunit TatC [Alphaproteobacteria bacterium]|nr:twin-arginine translocase subunit TatC [Alphaproteobacteria bacterium]
MAAGDEDVSAIADKTPEDGAGEAQRMPLLDHLVELRTRLLISVGSLIVAFFVCFAFAEDFYEFLTIPLKNAMDNAKISANRMIFTGLIEGFFTQVKVAFFAALCVTFPIFGTQIWRFIAPGLYKSEKKAFLPFLLISPALFLLGAAMVYYVLMPLAWDFLLGFQTTAKETALETVLEPKISEYLSLVMKLIFAFGLCFQLPVLLTLMARAGLATSAGMKAKRKYAIVAVFVFAAIITPPDVVSQIALAIPMILLYEISIYCARLAEKKREAREAADA